MEKHEADSAALLGPDWCLVDATLLDALADRHLARPETMPLAFSQSPPGLAPCIVSRALVRELAASKSHFATIGGLVGYVPTAPRSDPIAKPSCLSVPHECATSSSAASPTRRCCQ